MSSQLHGVLAASEIISAQARPWRNAGSCRRVLELNDFDVIVAPGHLWPEEFGKVERRELCQALRADGIRIESLNLPALDLDLASCVREVRSYSVDVFGATLDLDAEIGGHGVVLVPGRVSSLPPPPVTPVWSAGFQIACHKPSETLLGFNNNL